MHRARALGSKVNNIIKGQMAIAMTLRGFDLGRSVTPIFLSMAHFLSRFSTFSGPGAILSQPRSQGFYLEGGRGLPPSTFKGKTLGTRLILS